MKGIRDESLLDGCQINTDREEENLVVTVACDDETEQYDQPDMFAPKRRGRAKRKGRKSPAPTLSIRSKAGRRIGKNQYTIIKMVPLPRHSDLERFCSHFQSSAEQEEPLALAMQRRAIGQISRKVK